MNPHDQTYYIEDNDIPWLVWAFVLTILGLAGVGFAILFRSAVAVIL